MNILKVQLSLCEGEKRSRDLLAKDVWKNPTPPSTPTPIPWLPGETFHFWKGLAVPDSLHQQGSGCVLSQIYKQHQGIIRSLSQTRVSV